MRKVKLVGTPNCTGTVVSEFTTTKGEQRIVVEWDEPYTAMIICNPGYVEDLGTEVDTNDQAS